MHKSYLLVIAGLAAADIYLLYTVGKQQNDMQRAHSIYRETIHTLLQSATPEVIAELQANVEFYEIMKDVDL